MLVAEEVQGVVHVSDVVVKNLELSLDLLELLRKEKTCHYRLNGVDGGVCAPVGRHASFVGGVVGARVMTIVIIKSYLHR